MRYCADTWYILALFAQEEKAQKIIMNVKEGKDTLIIPLTVFAESTKKLLQRGVPQEKIDAFFDAVEYCEKIKLVIPDKTIAREAAHVSLANGLSMLDSFVAATTKILLADSLLSADSDYMPLVKKKYLNVKSW